MINSDLRIAKLQLLCGKQLSLVFIEPRIWGGRSLPHWPGAHVNAKHHDKGALS